MDESPVATIHIDGAARGNPGPAAFAYVITRDGAPAVEDKGYLGSTTNNQAEYTALVKALERAARLGAKRLVVHSDSELLVKQMNGIYRVKNEELRTLYQQAKELCGHFDQVSIRHVGRGHNARADRLCNEALDAEQGPRAFPRGQQRQRSAGADLSREAALREEAVLCLRAAAAVWARGDSHQPPPEDVWEQLWSIIEDHGVLRKPRAP
ncbi:MAG TPA: ribonuclease HI family protein [Gemmataceae bacterium]|nr:ribonuclease HI family protein [Gemmataceae bacterium]